MTPASALPALSDIACAAFAIWSLPALWRVLSGRRVRQDDPLKIVAVLLISGRYGFTLVRWAFGTHSDMLAPAEALGRQGAFAWSIATVVISALVIRSYRRMA